MGTSQKTNEKRKYLALPFYLKELFSQISNHYLKSPLNNNYASLLNKLLITPYSKIHLVTTNYDTLLDSSIERLFNYKFDSFRRKYLDISEDGKVFNYLKVHGSINWSYFINSCPELENQEDIINGRVDGLDFILEQIKNATNVGLDSEDSKGLKKFPALAVPLGEYKYVNFQQIEKFKKQPLNIKHILVIGNSGRDNTIFELLNEIINEKVHLFIVDKEKESLIKVAAAFQENLNKKLFPMSKETNYYLGGFSHFINNSYDNWQELIVNNLARTNI